MRQVWQLRSCCSRQRTFLWMVVILIGFTVRPDLVGVTSLVRGLWLTEAAYYGLLRNLHSTGIDREKLRSIWTALCLRLFESRLVKVNGKIVLLGDGIKVGKEGRKMPGVKSLHQESNNNSKAEFIMGHSCQALCLLVQSVGSFFAVPLACQIHEGLVFSNRDSRTLLDKIILLLGQLNITVGFYLVVDAYYTSQKVALPLLKMGGHLVSRMKSTAVAYYPAPPAKRKCRGRRRKYGKKVRLMTLFETLSESFETAPSPVYGERGVDIRFRVLDLLWRPMGILVRFVLVEHPVRGRIVLFSTDLTLPALEVIRLYGLRAKIELGFKQSLHVLGVYAYHFWMKAMNKIRKGDGDQYLHRSSEKYRNQIRRKMRAYDAHIQLGLISQGLLQYLSVTCSREIWASFGSWLRTMNPDASPSEAVTMMAMKRLFPEFLAALPLSHILKKFLTRRIDLSRCPDYRLAA
ncbi:MAG: transposase [Desulfomonile tiedjei]|uniref:Transposase n=1 Tax=Desulfomonile tiedjei TaxID=2358 RepID=A0A9D6UZU1_9BACT|nr:transposase [Desulfomonile tiedjei]